MVYEHVLFIEVDMWIDQENKAKEERLALHTKYLRGERMPSPQCS